MNIQIRQYVFSKLEREQSQFKEVHCLSCGRFLFKYEMIEEGIIDIKCQACKMENKVKFEK